MQLRVSSRNSRLFSRAFVGVVFSGAATVVSAQTTVTLNQPTTQVVAATVRGGSYAKKNERSVLATRASSDLEYHRRAFLKFDTQNTIPAGSSVTSALLTVTVKMGSEDATRLVARVPGDDLVGRSRDHLEAAPQQAKPGGRRGATSGPRSTTRRSATTRVRR